jgi:Phage minor structural protein GP20
VADEKEGQAPTSTTSQEDTSGNGDDGQDPKTPAADELARARSEAARYRTELRDAQSKLKDAEKAQKERDDAEKTELQKAQDRARELEGEVATRDTKLRDLTLAQEVFKQAKKLDIVDEDAAFRLMDKGQVVYDEAGRPTNIDDLLTALVEDKPYLKGKSRTGPKPASTSTTQPDGQKTKAPLTRADIEKMTDDEVAERLEEVTTVLASESMSH